MAHIKEGELTVSGKRFGIVVSRFNEAVTKALLEGALNQLRRSGVRETDIEVAWVPGSFELPLALKAFAHERKFHGLIALGCILRGETTNYEHIAQATTDGISRVMFDYQLPVGFGLLTVETFDQALQRSGGKMGNKGREAAQSVIEMASLMDQFQKTAEIFQKSMEEWRNN